MEKTRLKYECAELEVIPLAPGDVISTSDDKEQIEPGDGTWV